MAVRSPADGLAANPMRSNPKSKQTKSTVRETHLTAESAPAPDIQHQTRPAALQLQQLDRALGDLPLYPDHAGRRIILACLPGVVKEGGVTGEFGTGHEDGLFGGLVRCFVDDDDDEFKNGGGACVPPFILIPLQE